MRQYCTAMNKDSTIGIKTLTGGVTAPGGFVAGGGMGGGGVTRGAVGSGGARAVVVNSGYANAATGRKGLEDAYAMQAFAASALRIEAGEVAVASTGVIGEHLPMDKISAGVETGCSGAGGGGGGVPRRDL